MQSMSHLFLARCMYVCTLRMRAHEEHDAVSSTGPHS